MSSLAVNSLPIFLFHTKEDYGHILNVNETYNVQIVKHVIVAASSVTVAVQIETEHALFRKLLTT